MKHVVALSGGKDSTAMALRLREVNPSVEYTYICTPTGNEPPELFAHWQLCERLLGSAITHIAPRYGMVETKVGPREKVVGWQEHSGTDLLLDLIRRQGVEEGKNRLPDDIRKWRCH